MSNNDVNRWALRGRGWSDSMIADLLPRPAIAHVNRGGAGGYRHHAWPADVVAEIEATPVFASRVKVANKARRRRALSAKVARPAQAPRPPTPAGRSPALHPAELGDDGEPTWAGGFLAYVEPLHSGCARWTGPRWGGGPAHWAVGSLPEGLPVYSAVGQVCPRLPAARFAWRLHSGDWAPLGRWWSWDCGTAGCVAGEHISPAGLTPFAAAFLHLAGASDLDDPDCWPWAGPLSRNGRPSYVVDGRPQSALRLASGLARIHFGRVAGLTCENELCVQPRHVRAE